MPESQKEIANFLAGLGFCNVFGVDEALFQKMRGEIVPQKDEAASQKLRFSEMILTSRVGFQKALLVSDYIFQETIKWEKEISLIKTDDFVNKLMGKN